MFIGLTGGMGCGKSSTLTVFAQWGWKTMDADSICHNLYSDKNSDFFSAMKARWGNKILTDDGTINRDAVGKLVFFDNEERKWLNSLIHPAVLQQTLNIYRHTKEENMLFDVPLLYEVGWEKHFDKIIVVWTTPELRLERLKKRGMKYSEIKKRDKTQISPEGKMEKADYVIVNNGTFKQLKEQCQIIINKINK